MFDYQNLFRIPPLLSLIHFLSFPFPFQSLLLIVCILWSADTFQSLLPRTILQSISSSKPSHPLFHFSFFVSTHPPRVIYTHYVTCCPFTEGGTYQSQHRYCDIEPHRPWSSSIGRNGILVADELLVASVFRRYNLEINDIGNNCCCIGDSFESLLSDTCYILYTGDWHLRICLLLQMN